MSSLPDPESPARNLEGWKEIANHLAVHVKTAQTCEANFPLPVHRFPGDKGRVWADPGALDAWKIRMDLVNGFAGSCPAKPGGFSHGSLLDGTAL